MIQAAGGAIIRNPAVCGAVGLHDDSLLVDPDSRGIANCFVYLSKAPKDIHPQLKALAMKNLVFDQKRCVFVPRSLFVQVGQTVEITSGDPIPHNVHIHPLRNQPINVLLPPAGHAAQAIMWTPTERESIPFRVSNDIHPWMTAHWLVLDHPYAAMTDTNGHFRIVGLSAGLYEFRIWHERADINRAQVSGRCARRRGQGAKAVASADRNVSPVGQFLFRRDNLNGVHMSMPAGVPRLNFDVAGRSLFQVERAKREEVVLQRSGPGHVDL